MTPARRLHRPTPSTRARSCCRQRTARVVQAYSFAPGGDGAAQPRRPPASPPQARNLLAAVPPRRDRARQGSAAGREHPRAPVRAWVRRGRLKQVQAGVGSAARDGQRARATAADIGTVALSTLPRHAWARLSRAGYGSYRRSRASGGVFRQFGAGWTTHRAALRDDARPMTDRHGPPAPPGCAVSGLRSLRWNGGLPAAPPESTSHPGVCRTPS